MGDAVKLHQPCPDCGSHDALTYYDDGSSYCFSCNTYRKGTVKEIRYMDEISLEESKWDELKPEAGVFSDIPDRKLTEATCKKFGVKVIKNSTGIAQHIYPYYDKDNHLLCQKVRTVAGKSFHVLNGSQMKNALLFGQNVFPASGKYITVCEGELDAMSVYQMQGSKYPVVSIKNGAGSLKDVKAAYPYLDSFENIVLCWDGDEAGRKWVQKIAAVLPPKKVKIVKMPEDYKDPSEFLKAGKIGEFEMLWWRAEEYKPQDIVKMSELWDRLKDFNKSRSYISTPWQGLNDMIYGFRPSQVVVFASGCVSAETEFFTGTCWKKISEYKKGDKVLQFDMNTFEATLVEPEAYIKKPCEWLYKFTSKYGIDMELTPEHNILYAPEDSTNLHKISAQDIVDKCPEFRGRIPTSFSYTGAGIPLTDIEIRLMLAVIADSCIDSKGVSTIKIKKERKKEELKQILKEWKGDYTWYDNTSTGFSIIKFIPPRAEKEFTSFWYNSSQEQLKLICNNVLKWDGTITGKRKRFDTTSKASADFVQFAFSACGYRARISSRDRRDSLHKHIEYMVQISERTFIGLRKAPIPVKQNTTDGYKYCFTVPSHCLILRCNGCIFCTGNTGMGKSLFLKDIMQHIIRTTDNRIGAFFLEEVAEDTAISMMSLEAGLNLRKPDIWKAQSEEDLKKWFEESCVGDKIDLYDGFDFDDIDLLIDKIRYLSKARDCKVIVLDHITMVAEGSEENTTAKLNKLMAELKKIAVAEGLIILSACHLRKSANAAKTHEEGGHVTLDDLKSASSIKQLSDIVIGLERNSQDADKTKANTTILRVLKNRDFGVKGAAAAVIYDTETTRLQEISMEEFNDTDEL